MRVWLRYCRDLEYVSESQWQAWRDEYQEIARMLQGLAKSTARRDARS
jgi:four helix bundle protein